MNQLEDTPVLVEIDDLYRYSHLQRRWLELYRISKDNASRDNNFVQDTQERDWVGRIFDHDHTRQLEANLDYLRRLQGLVTPIRGGVLNSNEEQKLEFSGLPREALDFLSHAGISVKAVDTPNLERLLQEGF
ncbi:hypothetical protein HYX05_03065 [Candidatus Woesearchaeota archaeon]|nr:hypothetical protein [Candidatus Woesearchaeota archaeon]